MFDSVAVVVICLQHAEVEQLLSVSPTPCNPADMLTAGLVVGLLGALISGQRAELLGATVGGSVLVTCKLPVPTSPKWFYWQEDGTENILIHCEQTCQQTTSEVYRNRVTVFASEFGSGNISIKLHSVTAADDQKSFWVMASFKDRRERRCNSTLQVSASYRDINLTIDTADTVTCTARGGYPESSVSWSGQNTTGGEYVDLHEYKPTHERDAKDGTFTVRSSVSVKELVSVTCRITNPRSNQSINTTTKIDRDGAGPDTNPGVHAFIRLVSVSVASVAIAGLAVGTYICYKKRCKSGDESNGQLNGEQPGGENHADQQMELQEESQEAANEGSRDDEDPQDEDEWGDAHRDNVDQNLLDGAENQEHRPAGGAEQGGGSVHANTD
ncbi:CD276 antigen isoform X1 [Maylandia zebra]|uniref:CD276 antigen isoform X1 n=2 Tax=Maylandia zebra TaxID=106582 RepID=UPI00403C717C